MHGHHSLHSRHPQHRPTKADVITEYRRNALLHAAVQVFGEHGFDCATMEQIAQRADVAKGTTYLYYRSKQSIYDAALSHGLAELDERTRDAIDRAPNLRDAIPAFVTGKVPDVVAPLVRRKGVCTPAEVSITSSFAPSHPKRTKSARSPGARPPDRPKGRPDWG